MTPPDKQTQKSRRRGIKHLQCCERQARWERLTIIITTTTYIRTKDSHFIVQAADLPGVVPCSHGGRRLQLRQGVCVGAAQGTDLGREPHNFGLSHPNARDHAHGSRSTGCSNNHADRDMHA
jgi:hypothetical protein